MMHLTVQVTASQGTGRYVAHCPARPASTFQHPPAFTLANTRPQPPTPDLQARLLKAWGRLFAL